MNHEFLQLHQTLEDDDYGIVVGKDGSLKGIWVPRGEDHLEEVPDTIARLCIEYFGLDPNDETNYNTIH
jgi:hypothetical protein